MITPKRALAIAELQSLSQQLDSNPHAREALASSGAIIVTSSLEEAIAIAQRVAPEHAVCDTADVARRLTRAGTVFVGGLSAQACGDYATGSNHVLPTSGAARFRGGLSAADFVRVTSIQRLTREGLRTIGDTAVTLAEAEGLHGHARSIRMRLGGVA
jgi:histidinol dehydrogenase